jgi:tetratricopeptide (TPR) repeat protein
MKLQEEIDRVSLLLSSESNSRNLVARALTSLVKKEYPAVNSDISKLEKSNELIAAKEIACIAHNHAPDNEHFLVQYSTLLVKTVELALAEKTVTSFKKNYPQKVNIWVSSTEASIYKHQGRFDEAISTLRAIPNPSQSVLDDLAECFLLKQDYATLKDHCSHNQLTARSALYLAKSYYHEHAVEKAHNILIPFLGYSKQLDSFFKNLPPVAITTQLGNSLTSQNLQEPLKSFLEDYDPSKSVFIMMKLPDGKNKTIDEQLIRLQNAIRLETQAHGMTALWADDNPYSADIFDNVQVYMNGCTYGVAVLENLFWETMNPSVAIEYGYMFAKGKKILLLKEDAFTNINADLLGKLWVPFKIDDLGTVQKAIVNWMISLKIIRNRKI